MNKDALTKILTDVNKLYKTELFIRLNDPSAGNFGVERISSDRLSIDLPFGGGVPKGRIVELFGQESSGKTTIALHIAAAFQKVDKDRAVAFLDYEHSFDKFYAEALGVDIDTLVFSQPTFAEQGLQGVDNLLDTGKFSLIIIDSVAAMIPEKELKGEIGDSSIGVQARIMSQTLRKITGKANINKTTVIFINQLREKIGVMFGSPWVTAGGNALKFYASIRAEVKRGAKTTKEDHTTGNRGSITVVKNKTAPPYMKAEYDLEFGVGISKEGELIDYGVESEIIKKSGSWYSYGETKLGQGKDGVKKILKDNPDLQDELFEKITKAVE
jgi:recombination protein RecA